MTTMILRTFTRQMLRRNTPLKTELKSIDHVICIDLECTCDSPTQIMPMEVIEIACYKLDVKSNSQMTSSHPKSNHINNTIKKDKLFQRYVKPTINPELSTFCQDLTGIIQSTVDNAQTIDIVVGDLVNWLKTENLVDDQMKQKKAFAFASCGNFDLNILSPVVRKYLFNNEFELLPIYFKEWINVKKLFVNHKKEWPKGLYHMIELLGEEPEGRLHSAKDDCLNLARIIECLHQDGCRFHITNRLVK